MSGLGSPLKHRTRRAPIFRLKYFQACRPTLQSPEAYPQLKSFGATAVATWPADSNRRLERQLQIEQCDQSSRKEAHS